MTVEPKADLSREALYSRIFDSFKPVAGYLLGTQVKDFFLRTELPNFELCQIWEEADITKDGRLDRSEFITACRLIDQAAVKYGKPQLNSMLSTIGKAFPADQSTSSSVISPITESIRQKYTELFRSLDPNGTGSLSGPKAKSILSRSGLSNSTLAHIWNLSDITRDGRLSLDEFILAMHLVDAAKSGIILPRTIPPNIVSQASLTNMAGAIDSPVPSSSRHSSFCFEDKRKENLEKGNQELERRRQRLRELENFTSLERKQSLQSNRLYDDDIFTGGERKSFSMLPPVRDAHRSAARLELSKQVKAETELREKRMLAENTAKLQEEVDGMRASVKGVQYELHSVEEKMSVCDKRIKDLGAATAECNEQIEATQQEVNVKSGELKVLEERAKEMNNEYTKRVNDLRELRLLLDHAKEEQPLEQTQTAEDKKLEQLKKNLDEMKKKEEELRLEVADLMTDAEIKKRECLNSEEKIFDLSKEISSKEAQIKLYLDATLNADVCSNRDDIKDLLGVLEELKGITHDDFKTKRHDSFDTENAHTFHTESAFNSNVVPHGDTGINERTHIDDPFIQNDPFAFISSDVVNKSFDSWGKNVDTGWANFDDLKFEHNQTSDDFPALRPNTNEASAPTSFPSGSGLDLFSSAPGHSAATSEQSTSLAFDPFAPSVNEVGAKSRSGFSKSFDDDFCPLSTDTNYEKKFTSLYPSKDSSDFFDVNVDRPSPSQFSRRKITRNKPAAPPPPLKNSDSSKEFYEEYRAQFPYDAITKEDLSFKAGDIIRVDPYIRAGNDDWLWGELNDQSGYFPKCYTEKISSNVTPSNTANKKILPGSKVIATSSYRGKLSNHLPFDKGDIITIRDEIENWYSGSLKGKIGWLPKTYVRALSEDDFPSNASSIHSEDFGTKTAPVLYRAICDFKSSNDTDLNFEENDIISVLSMSGNWWSGKIGSRTGLFPYNYVEKVPVPGIDGTVYDPKVRTAEALYSYDTQHPDDLNFVSGDKIEILGTAGKSWYFGRMGTRTGLLPANYVQIKQS